MLLGGAKRPENFEIFSFFGREAPRHSVFGGRLGEGFLGAKRPGQNGFVRGFFRQSLQCEMGFERVIGSNLY